MKTARLIAGSGHQEVDCRAQTGQSVHTAVNAPVSTPRIDGEITGAVAQTALGSIHVDNRKPINEQRARMILALLKAA